MKWEDMCSRCGLCCHEKCVYKGFLLIDSEKTCAFFDKKTSLCTVYESRFSKCPRCRKVTPLMAITAPYLPPSCAYVQWAKRHRIRFRRDMEMVLASLDE